MCAVLDLLWLQGAEAQFRLACIQSQVMFHMIRKSSVGLQVRLYPGLALTLSLHLL